MQAPPQTTLPPAPLPDAYGSAPAPGHTAVPSVSVSPSFVPQPLPAMPSVLPVLLPAVPPPRLVPRSVAEIIDEGVRAVRRDIGLFATIAAFTVVPTSLLTAFVTALFTPFNALDPLTYFRVGNTAAVTGNSAFTVLVTTLLAFASIAIAALGTAALVTAAGLRTLGQPCTVGNAYRHARRRYWAVLRAQVAILFTVGAVALFSAGLATPLALWLYVAWQLAPQAVVLEGKGPLAALRRSREITQGGWWRLAWMLLIVATLGVFVAAVPMGVRALVQNFTLSKDALGGPAGAVIVTVLNVLVAIVLQPITVTVLTLAFTDQRVRREGFDVDVLLQRGAAARAAGGNT